MKAQLKEANRLEAELGDAFGLGGRRQGRRPSRSNAVHVGQGGTDLLKVRITMLRALFEAASEQPLQIRRDTFEIRRNDRVYVLPFFPCSASGPGESACKHLEEEDSERVDVGSRVRSLCIGELLW